MRVPKRLLLHLTHRVARQGFDEEHALGQFIAGKPIPQGGEDRLFDFAGAIEEKLGGFKPPKL